MAERLGVLELEILQVLRMDPETPELLAELVAPGDVRGLVRALRVWAADPSSDERVEAYWWELTEECRSFAGSRPG